MQTLSFTLLSMQATFRQLLHQNFTSKIHPILVYGVQSKNSNSLLSVPHKKPKGIHEINLNLSKSTSETISIKFIDEERHVPVGTETLDQCSLLHIVVKPLILG